MRIYSYVLMFVMLCVWKLNAQISRTALDNLTVPFRAIRLWFHNQLRTYSKSTQNQKSLIENNKLQESINKSMPFPCSLKKTQSPVKPESVHTLRPGDIDVIGAIGDSLTAGFGLSASSIIGEAVEERGKSFSIGGQATWREYLTLPNILKEFNPNLIGYSLAPSLSIQKESQFNVAEGGAVSRDIPYMTKVLIKRIKADKRVHVKTDWKMITMMIGDNDFCSKICYYKDPYKAIENHKRDVLEALRLLRDNLPRTIVNIIPAPHIKILANLEPKPPLCRYYHTFLCPCLFGLLNEKKRSLYYDVMDKWQIMDFEVANYAEFDKDDFTVVVQSFSLNYTIKNFEFLAVDCFHFSQKGNAEVANGLWNNLLEPVGGKLRGGTALLKNFNCPTKENPYIFTRRNS